MTSWRAISKVPQWRQLSINWEEGSFGEEQAPYQCGPEIQIIQQMLRDCEDGANILQMQSASD